jgi:hypothetical protein
LSRGGVRTLMLDAAVDIEALSRTIAELAAHPI